MQLVKRWGGILLSERALIGWFIVFLIIAAIIRVGHFPERVMRYDMHVMGPFIAKLVAYPHFYDGSVVSMMRPMGFVTLIPLLEGMLFRYAGLEPIILSYVITVTGNVVFVFALFTYAKLYLNDKHAMAAALIAYTLRIDMWNLSHMGNLQIYPTSTDLASAATILAFTYVLREKWFHAVALLVLTSLLHPVYALFAALSCALAAFFDKSAPLKETLMRQAAFGAVALMAVGIPVIVVSHWEQNQVSSDYFLPLLYGFSGHSQAWLSKESFLSGLGWLSACTLGFILDSNQIPRLATALFWCTFAVVIGECIAQWIGIIYQFSYAAALGESASSRCSTYIAYLAFPLLYRAILVRPLSRAEHWHRIFKVAPTLILVAVLIITFKDCWAIGQTSKSSLLKEKIAVSKWMQTTPVGTRFLTADLDFEQNSFSLRPAVFPGPYTLSFVYRIRDERMVKFDQDMVQFWGPPSDHGRRWLENYMNDIQNKRVDTLTEPQVLQLSKMFSSQYFIAHKKAAPLSWPVALTTDNFTIYKIPSENTPNNTAIPN